MASSLALIGTACFGPTRTIKGIRFSDYVNPFIGASVNTKAVGAYHDLGKTFPGVTTPFGMIQVGPNTITGGDNSFGYSCEYETIGGFALTQMGGIGRYGDLDNLLVMPTVGSLHTDSGEEGGVARYRSRYGKSFEEAKAGYYRVLLSDYQTQAETTAALHSGILRFIFPENKQSCIQLDLARRVGGTSTYQAVQMIDDHTIAGRMECTPEGGGWGNGGGSSRYTMYFYVQFSKPLKDYGVWSVDIPARQDQRRGFMESPAFQILTANIEVSERSKAYESEHLGFFTEFGTEANEEVLFKVDISFISLEGTEKNLKAEIRGWDFDAVRPRTRSLWDAALAKMGINDGANEQKVIFYTSLYHTVTDPRIYADVDSQYMGTDGKTHKSDTFTKRTIFSGWGMFRSQMPLRTIISPVLVDDLLKSLTVTAEGSGRGYYKRWELLNAYSGCMLRNPAISVLTDTYTKGIYSLDMEKAYRYANKVSRMFGNAELGYAPNPQSISKTLEYAYTEQYMSQLARPSGEQEDAVYYAKLVQSYQNLYDAEEHSFHPREVNGRFEAWPEEDELKEWYGCMKCNKLQREWFIPYDIPGMVELMRETKRAITDPDTVFDKILIDFLWNAYYNYANESVHYVPFLYNCLGQSWKTQKWSRFICGRTYKNKVEGSAGSEDVGQTSAWYVLAVCGLYPVCPGDTRYEISSPVSKKTETQVGEGNISITRVNRNTPESAYIQSTKLNGMGYTRYCLDYRDIMKDGTLELEMDPESSTNRGVNN